MSELESDLYPLPTSSQSAPGVDPDKNEESEDRLLTVEEAAVYVGVSEASVSNWIRAEKLPFEQEGRTRKIWASVLDTVKVLIAEHGRSWSRYVTWESGDDATGDTDASVDVVELDDKEWIRFWGIMRGAKTLYDKGDEKAAAAVVFTTFDAFEVL